MNFEIHAWQPSHEGVRSEWVWYWYIDILDGRSIVGVIQQPHHIGHYESKSDAEAAAQAVIDLITGHQ